MRMRSSTPSRSSRVRARPWRRDDDPHAGDPRRWREDAGARARAVALRARAPRAARPARGLRRRGRHPRGVPAHSTAAPSGADGAAGGAALHAPRAAELFGRYRDVSARLVHDEVQPEGERPHGVLALAYEIEQMLAKITGMDFVSLQPQAGAQSEFTALLVFKAYHARRGEAATRRRIIVPDSAHGTNPASAAMCGYQVTTVKSDARGNVDLDALKAALGPDVAGFMLTNPNTLGLFEERVREVCDAVHAAGALVYGDGANMNALLGVARPGDLGFDCVHINVHKTFSTPHGAGGPGAGPLCVKAHLRPFLPKPWIVREADGSYHYDTAREDREPAGLGDSIGTIKQRLGNFGVLVRAYTYMKTLGEEGMVETGRDAILAANYLLALLRPAYDLAYDRPPMHEFVLSAAKQKKQGASALDLSKALLDEGFHSPTVYFPLIVPEAMMIEPTETEPKETLDAFAAAMLRIAERVKTDPAAVRDAPRHAPLRRLDEVAAARKPVLRYKADA